MIENIPFQEIADSMTDIQKKLFITLLTPQVFNADNNAFLVGCSEETMRWKYYEYSGLWFNEKIIRETLSEIMLPGKGDRYSTFIPTDFTSKATMGPIKTNTFITTNK